MSATAARIGLRINTNKTKILSFYTEELGKLPISNNRQMIGGCRNARF